MPLVCINRPNRSAPRRFTERDLERIAKTMLSQGHTIRNIVATVLVATGSGLLICALSGAIQRVLGILRIIQQIAALLSGAALTRALLIWLSRAARIPIPGTPIIVAAITALVLAVQALQEGFLTLVQDVTIIDSVTEVLDDWCQAVQSKLT